MQVHAIKPVHTIQISLLSNGQVVANGIPNDYNLAIDMLTITIKEVTKRFVDQAKGENQTRILVPERRIIRG